MFTIRNPRSLLIRLARTAASPSEMELRKAEYRHALQKNVKRAGSLMQPRTYEEQIELINNPQLIKYIEVVEYGVTLPKTRKWPAILAFCVALFLYAHYEALPIAIVERYMSISQQIDKHPVGYLGSFLAFSGSSYYVYQPLLLVIYHSSRYIKYYWPLLLISLIANSHLGKMLAQKDLDSMEVWNRTKISYGEGLFLQIGFALWGYLGFKGGLGGVWGSRIFLETLPGIGIMNKGIPIGSILLLYIVYQAYRAATHEINGGRSELIFSSMVLGTLYGVLLRRFKIKP